MFCCFRRNAETEVLIDPPTIHRNSHEVFMKTQKNTYDDKKSTRLSRDEVTMTIGSPNTIKRLVAKEKRESDRKDIMIKVQKEKLEKEKQKIK
jgi:hypothetical protein